MKLHSKGCCEESVRVFIGLKLNASLAKRKTLIIGFQNFTSRNFKNTCIFCIL
jgi:hypothetical protein